MDPLTMAALGGTALDFGVGLFQGESERRQAERAKRDLLAGINKSREIYGDTYNETSGMYDDYVDRGEDAWGRMQGIEQDLDPSQFALPELGDFNAGYNKNVNDFLDPSMAYEMDQGNRALQGSAAAAGGLLSGKTLRDMQRHSQGLAQGNWNNAQGALERDKTFAYNDFTNKFNTSRANIQDRYGKIQDQYGRANAQYGIGRGAVGTQAGLRNNFGGQMAGLSAQEANVRAQGQYQNSMMDDIVGGVCKLAKGAGQAFAGMKSPISDVGSMGMQDFGTNSYNNYQSMNQNPYGMQAPNFSQYQNNLTAGMAQPITPYQFPNYTQGWHGGSELPTYLRNGGY